MAKETFLITALRQFSKSRRYFGINNKMILIFPYSLPALLDVVSAHIPMFLSEISLCSIISRMAMS
jgi:hypothetical protein